MSVKVSPAPDRPRQRIPRLGFLGVGWIGRQRMASLARDGIVDPVAVADTDPRARAEAGEAVPGIATMSDLSALLDVGLDGIAIATPSALHSDQAIAALERGVAVFCQKPMARTADETRRVVAAARRHDRLLGVDLSYRHLHAVRRAREMIARGDVGDVYAADLVFHNAYGPDKPWCETRNLSGGGCLIDLGTHLVDLALWLTGAETATVEWARLLRRGRPVATDAASDEVEDHARAQIRTDGGMTAQLACSWFLPIGADCEIAFTLYGTKGAIAIRNVNGSFYDFVAHHHRGTLSEVLTEPPDEWGPRAIAAWASALGGGAGFDPEAERYITLAEILDDINGAACAS